MSNFKAEKDHATRNDYYQQIRNNIVAFVGDRGSGKTSCLQTVYQALESHNDEDLLGKKFKNVTFRILPTIDPSYFEEKSNILEIVLANMFSTFKKDASKTQTSNNNEDYLVKKRKLVECFQKVKDTLDIINNEDIKPSNDSIEKLSALSACINMKKRMTDLVENYLEYFDNNNYNNKENQKILLIAIDDMDIQTKHAFKMVEQIRKYLIIPNVIILVGVKLTQLTDIVKQAYYKEYKTIIDKQSLSDTVEDMAGRYMSKLIPYNHRMFLPDFEIELNRKIKIINTEEENFNRIDEAVLHLIYRKTRLMFYNSDTGTSLIVPRNLRDLLNLCSLLYGMEVIPKGENYKTIAQKNRTLFEKYFIESWCYEHLDSEKYKFIQEVISLSIENVNKKFMDYLCEFFKEKEKEKDYDKRLFFPNNKVYNISLADVNYLLGKIDDIKNKKNIGVYFVFALRTIYTMLLYNALEIDDSGSQLRCDESFDIRYKNTEDDKNKALRRENKLLVYSNYERLLGGELLFIDNAFRNPKKPDGEPLVTNESKDFIALLHHHKINIKKLKEVYNHAIGNIQGPTTISIDKKVAFQICEFFLLTLYSTKSNPFYRVEKHCYYDNFPDDILIGYNDSESDDIAIYNSPSILFNIVKYYYYYKQYCRLLSQKFRPNKKINNFIKFWEKCVSNRKELLILGILENPKEEGKEEGKHPFQNKNVERVFIRNLEMLDKLQDYLPYTGKQELNQSFNDIGKITDFFEKLSEFNFYLYPKEKDKEKDKENENDIIYFSIFNKIKEFLSKVNLDDKTKKVFLEIFKSDSF